MSIESHKKRELRERNRQARARKVMEGRSHPSVAKENIKVRERYRLAMHAYKRLNPEDKKRVFRAGYAPFESLDWESIRKRVVGRDVKGLVGRPGTYTEKPGGELKRSPYGFFKPRLNKKGRVQAKFKGELIQSDKAVKK